MLYEKYFRKITKRAKRLKIVRKFRVPITMTSLTLIASVIFLISMIIVSGTLFVITQGLVYSESDCPSSIYYGDSLGYEAEAIFSDVRYEYASTKDPEKWSQDEPVLLGS